MAAKTSHNQRTPWGVENRGEENLTNDTPSKKGFWTLLVRYVFPLLSGVSALLFLYRIHDRAEQKLFWRGPKIFGRARVLHPPPISRPKHKYCTVWCFRAFFCTDCGKDGMEFVSSGFGQVVPMRQKSLLALAIVIVRFTIAKVQIVVFVLIPSLAALISDLELVRTMLGADGMTSWAHCCGLLMIMGNSSYLTSLGCQIGTFYLCSQTVIWRAVHSPEGSQPNMDEHMDMLRRRTDSLTQSLWKCSLCILVLATPCLLAANLPALLAYFYISVPVLVDRYRNIAILSPRYPVSRDTFQGRLTRPQKGAIQPLPS